MTVTWQPVVLLINAHKFTLESLVIQIAVFIINAKQKQKKALIDMNVFVENILADCCRIQDRACKSPKSELKSELH